MEDIIAAPAEPYYARVTVAPRHGYRAADTADRSGPGRNCSAVLLVHKMPECNICAAPYTKSHTYTCAQCAFVCCQVCHVRALTEPTLGRCPGCPAGLDFGTFLINVPVLAAGAQEILAEHFGKLLALRERDFALADPNSGESLAISRGDPSLAMDFLDTGAPLSAATYGNLRARTDVRALYTYAPYYNTRPEVRPVPYTNAIRGRRLGKNRAEERDRYLELVRVARHANTELVPGGWGPRPAVPDGPVPLAHGGPGAPGPAGHDPLAGEAEADLRTIRAAGVDCRACPKCRAIISRVSGCSQMWCVLCHAKFDYVTGAIITGFFHNPHFFSHISQGQQREGGQERLWGMRDEENLAIWYDEVLLLCREYIRPDRGNSDGATRWADFCQAAYKTARAVIAVSVFAGIIENARLGIEELTCGEAVVRLRSAAAQFNSHKRIYAPRNISRALGRAAAVIELAPPGASIVRQRNPLNRRLCSASVVVNDVYDIEPASGSPVVQPSTTMPRTQ